jgi:D-alanyl-lipoteichoic acid acyltransferase DltB (MBOAT superfamily)
MTAALGGFTVGLPELRNLMAQGADAPWAVSWASVYAELFADVLRLAIKGHLIVGFLRLYGFHVFRNTYKPLLAESVVEFWNRYFYYFKELLVTFFFMPTFTGVGRRFQRIPALRLLAAVVAAAFVGNVYYHLIKESAALARG